MIKNHTYSVEFRILGKDLDPSVITKELGLDPCQVRKAGTRKGSKVYEQAMWAFDGNAEESEWETLEKGLAFVLDELWPQKSKIGSMKSKYELIWWCGHFQNSNDGGPTLSPELLKRLGEFGVPLFIDNYFSEDE